MRRYSLTNRIFRRKLCGQAWKSVLTGQEALMSITEARLRHYCQSWWHWSHFFQDWLVKLIVDGRMSGYSDDKLEPLFDQLRTEIGEDHPGLLLKTIPGIVPASPSAAVAAMIAYVHHLTFEESLYALLVNEQAAWRTYDRIVREVEAAKIEADLVFFKRHLELDQGEHQEGAERLYRKLVVKPDVQEPDPRWMTDHPPQSEHDICGKLVALRAADLVVTFGWHDLVDVKHASQWLAPGHGTIGG